MSKHLCILLLSFVFITTSFSQKPLLEQVFGLSASTSNLSGLAQGVKDSVAFRSDYKLKLQEFGFVYGPRIDLYASKNLSLSLAVPLMAGVSATSGYHSYDANSSNTRKDTVSGIMGLHFAVEVPVFADINIGLHSASDPTSKSFGLFAGIGYSYSYSTITTSVGHFRYDGFNPMLRAGIRLGSAWENRFSIAFSVRGGTGAANRTYGIQLLKDL
jgi:hypothetical protein